VKQHPSALTAEAQSIDKMQATARKNAYDLLGNVVLGSDPSELSSRGGEASSGLSPQQKAKLQNHAEAWALSQRIALPSAREAKVIKDVVGTVGLIVEVPEPRAPSSSLPQPHYDALPEPQPSPRVAEVRQKVAAAEEAARHRAEREAAAEGSGSSRINFAEKYEEGIRHRMPDPVALKRDLTATHFTIAGPESAEELAKSNRWQRKTELLVASPPPVYQSSRSTERAFQHLRSTMSTSEMMGGKEMNAAPPAAGFSRRDSASVVEAHRQAAVTYESNKQVAGSRKADLLKSHFSFGSS
jgi:hypothetical protein